VDGASEVRRAGSLLRTRRPLVAICVLAAVAEASVIQLSGATWATRLAPQVVAAAPWGLFHDLRWLVVYHDSWWGFGLELAGLLGFRSTLDALIIRAAWPDGEEPPRFATAWRRTFGFTVAAAVLLAPWVTLLFGMAVVSLSWLFFAAVPPVVVMAVLIHPGAVAPGWWRRTVPLRAVGWVALTFVVMTLCAAVVSADRAVLGVPVAAAGGLFNAWAWRGMVGSVASVRRSQRFVPLVPAGIAFMLAVVAVGTDIGFGVASSDATAARATQARLAAAGGSAPAVRGGRPVLVAAGFGTSWDGVSGPWLPGPFDEARFSYAGLGPGSAPLAYRATDTYRSLGRLDTLMAAQVDSLHRSDHRRVSIIAASEGALVAETYLARHPTAPVDQLILLSPLVEPGRVYYPPAGGTGWGMVTSLGLDALTRTIGDLSPLRLSPATPLLRSIVAEAPAIRSLGGCPPAGVRQVLVVPVADAVAAPADGTVSLPAVVIPAFHSGALDDPGVEPTLLALLGDRAVPGTGTWSFLDSVIQGASTAWQVPELALTVNRAWVLPSGASPTDGVLSCRDARLDLSQGLGS